MVYVFDYLQFFNLLMYLYNHNRYKTTITLKYTYCEEKNLENEYYAIRRLGSSYWISSSVFCTTTFLGLRRHCLRLCLKFSNKTRSVPSVTDAIVCVYLV